MERLACDWCNFSAISQIVSHVVLPAWSVISREYSLAGSGARASSSAVSYWTVFRLFFIVSLLLSLFVCFQHELLGLVCFDDQTRILFQNPGSVFSIC